MCVEFYFLSTCSVNDYLVKPYRQHAFLRLPCLSPSAVSLASLAESISCTDKREFHTQLSISKDTWQWTYMRYCLVEFQKQKFWLRTWAQSNVSHKTYCFKKSGLKHKLMSFSIFFSVSRLLLRVSQIDCSFFLPYNLSYLSIPLFHHVLLRIFQFDLVYL